MAFVNGQPWRIQPWNTEQNEENLGPWLEEEFPCGILTYDQLYRAVAFNNKIHLLGRYYTPTKYNWLDFQANIDTSTGRITSIARLTTRAAFTGQPVLTGDKVTFVGNCRNVKIAENNDLDFYSFDPHSGGSSDDQPVVTKNKILVLRYTDKDKLIYKRFLDIDTNGIVGADYTDFGTDSFGQITTFTVTRIGERIYLFYVLYSSREIIRCRYADIDADTGYIGSWSGESSFKPNLGSNYINRFGPPVVTANRIYLFFGDSYHDTARIFTTTINNGLLNEEFSSYEIFRNTGTSVDFKDGLICPIVTKSRLYLLANNITTSLTTGYVGRIFCVSTPFNGGDPGGGTVTAVGDYVIAPEIHARGESVPTRAARGNFEHTPEIAAEGEDVAAGTFRGRVVFEPGVFGTAEDVAAGTFRGRVELSPEIAAKGEDVAAGTVAGRVALSPEIAAQGESVAAGTVAGHFALSPRMAGRAETVSAGTLAGRVSLEPSVSGKAETAAAGTTMARYDLQPEIGGKAETAAKGLVAGHYDLRPEIAALGESAAAGTTGGRYDLRPEVAASGESVRAGTLAADYEIAPEIGATGESAESGTSAGNYNLFLPSVRATGEQAAKGAMRAMFAARPTIRAKGETVAKGTVTGHCRIAPAIFGQARKTGRVHHAYGNYVLPVPLRIRGTCEQRVGDWVLRFKRPEVL